MRGITELYVVWQTTHL